jgi:hypothetical protein
VGALRLKREEHSETMLLAPTWIANRRASSRVAVRSSAFEAVDSTSSRRWLRQ